ncbi:MAG: hypothetical protein Q9182_000463 [Xanthomendoza sp. 2 TL-2023]
MASYIENGTMRYLAPSQIPLALEVRAERLQSWEYVLDGFERRVDSERSSAHAGLRTRLSGDDWEDYIDDDRQGFLRISSDDIDDMGTKGITDAILKRIGLNTPTYLSIDIDVIDPGTGTPEPGGWTSRELIKVIRGLEDLNVVGADIVEVAPAYDGTGEQTALTAAQLGFEILTNWVGRGMSRRENGKGEEAETIINVGDHGSQRDEL